MGYTVVFEMSLPLVQITGEFFFTFIVLFQIKKVVLALGDYLKCTCESSIGGTRVQNEMQKLQASPPQIIVGTPGRVFDMLKRKVLRKFHISGKGVHSVLPHFTPGANEPLSMISRHFYMFKSCCIVMKPHACQLIL